MFNSSQIYELFIKPPNLYCGSENFLARVFVLWVGFSSFAGGAKQVFKMRNFSTHFKN